LILILAISGWQVYLQQDFMRFAAQYDTPNGYGPVVGPLWQTASAASAAAGADDAQILVVAQGDDPTWDNLPSALDVLLPRSVSHRFVSDPTALVYPLGPTVYVVTPDAPQALAELTSQPDADLLQQISAPGDQRFWIFRRSNHSRDDVLADMTPLEPPLRLSNGVEVLAYRFGGDQQPGGVLQLTLAWWLYDGSLLPRSTGLTAERASDYHAFAHLVDGGGQRWGQQDLLSFPSASWRAGDLVLTRFNIQTSPDAPPGEYWVNTGMYSYPGLVAAPMLDVAGNPAADFMQVPLQLGQ
jgi:hypothetical protein